MAPGSITRSGMLRRHSSGTHSKSFALTLQAHGDSTLALESAFYVGTRVETLRVLRVITPSPSRFTALPFPRAAVTLRRAPESEGNMSPTGDLCTLISFKLPTHTAYAYINKSERACITGVCGLSARGRRTPSPTNPPPFTAQVLDDTFLTPAGNHDSGAFPLFTT